ncbi:hypothetical protein CR513_30101, partial [Mucuna pruriens]
GSRRFAHGVEFRIETLSIRSRRVSHLLWTLKPLDDSFLVFGGGSIWTTTRSPLDAEVLWTPIKCSSPTLDAQALLTFDSKPNIFNNKSYEPKQMENNNRMLKELAMPDLEPAQSYELKSGLTYLLSKFHGLAGEDSPKHLKEFHMVCTTMRPQGIPEDYIKMKVLPFSLDGAAKD